jgi:hypothetical protein
MGAKVSREMVHRAGMMAGLGKDWDELALMSCECGICVTFAEIFSTYDYIRRDWN